MIDAHAHLDDPQFASDLDAVIARASDAGITRILSCGEDAASSERNLAIARRSPSVRVAVGVHPHRAESWSDEVRERIAALVADKRVVAIGEIGLDRSGRSAAVDAQLRAFEAQLRLARELDLPVVVHVRDAGAIAREVIDRVGGVRGMIHCYSEGADEVPLWCARGFTLSFAGTVTYPKNARLREAAAACPADRLLTETDAPYLAPQARRGRRNEPAFVADTLRVVADAREGALERVAEQVAEAAKALFGQRWT
ncbi:MAG TPA: TatD family hydrolase [Candidatus Limnocylindrales bacterium]|nr:TatD family hydrolase [Candidatus Limnocylindrales bacterium]